MPHYSRRLFAATLAPLTVLAFAACSEEEPDSDPEASESADSTSEEQVQTIPVATDFFEETPEWSAPVPADASVFLVGEHVVWYSSVPGTIGAYDASGAEVWTEDIEPFGPLGDDGGIDADFRIVDDQTVAIVQGGTTEPDGLNDSEVLYRTWLYDVATGLTGEPAEVSADGYQPGEHGLAFVDLDGEGEPNPLDPSFTVSAAGEVTEHEPVTETLAGTPVFETPNMTVGGTPVFDIRGETESYSTTPTEGTFDGGFGGEGWNSMDIAPASAPNGGEDSEILAVAGDHTVIARWYATGGEGDEDVFGVVDVANGELVTEVTCQGETYFDYFEGYLGAEAGISADDRYIVTQRSIIDSQTGETYCADSDRAVVLRSVDGQGRAFGDIDVDGDAAEAVMVGVDGEATTTPTAAGVYAPLGFLEGDLAVHYDRDAGIVAVNRLKV